MIVRKFEADMSTELPELPVSTEAGDKLAIITSQPALAHLKPVFASSGLTLTECFSVLASGRPALLELLKTYGVSNLRDRQAVAKAVAVTLRGQQVDETAAAPPPLERWAPKARQPQPVLPGPMDAQSGSRSQPGYFQDVRCLQFHDWKFGGYYLEVGVDNAVQANNTVLLDETFGWRGITVDPNASYINQRTSRHFAVALASTSGTSSFSWSGPFSGLTEFVSSPVHNHMWHDMADRMWTSTVRTCTPLEVLEAAEAPEEIDYLSLDVEGAEMEILRAFPFDRFRIAFSTIETNNDHAKEDELRAFMEEKGYCFVGHAGNDDYFALSGDPRVGKVAFSPSLDYIGRGEHAKRSRS
jgi:hypothetical protein